MKRKIGVCLGLLSTLAFAPAARAAEAPVDVAAVTADITTYRQAYDAASRAASAGRYAEAAVLWEKAAKLADNDRDRRDMEWTLASTLRQLGRWEEAEKHARAAADLSIAASDKAYYLRLTGETIRYVGDVLNSEAGTLANNRKPEEAEKKLAAARAKWTAAAKVYEESAAVVGGDRGSALRDLADTRRRLKDYEGAREAFRQMAAYNIEYARVSQTYDSSVQIAQTYLEEAKYADARATLEKALSTEGMPPFLKVPIIDMLRECARRESNWPAARDAARKMLEQPGLTADGALTAFSGLAESYRQERDTAKMIEAYKEAVASPLLPPVYKASFLSAMADAYREQKNLAAGREAIGKGLEVPGLPNRTVASLRVTLATIARDENNLAAAHAEFEKIINDPKMHEDDVRNALRWDGDLCVQEQNWSAARVSYNKLKAMAGQNQGNLWDAQTRILGTYVSEKKIDDASALLKTMMATAGVNGDAKANAAWQMINAYPEDPASADSAVALADEVVAMTDLSPVWVGHFLRHKSERLVKLGRIKDAVETLEKLASSEGDANNRIDALFRMVNIHRSQNNVSEALNVCNRIVSSKDATEAHKQQVDQIRQQLAPTPAQ